MLLQSNKKYPVHPRNGRNAFTEIVHLGIHDYITSAVEK